MIDGIKIGICNYTANHFLQNPLLAFNGVKFDSDGEITSSTAIYKDLTIVVKGQTFCEIRGSLHKFYMQGVNYNNFTFTEICAAIKTLCNDLQIEPKNAKVQNLELGINIHIPFTPVYLFDRCIVYNNKPFNTFSNGMGYIIEAAQYVYKLYSKQIQGATNENVLRIEVRANKMKWLGSEQVTLETLCNKQYIESKINRVRDLINKTLIFDYTLTETPFSKPLTSLVTNGQNPLYWKRLSQDKRQFASRQRKTIDKLICEQGTENTKEILLKLIDENIELLLKNDYNFTGIANEVVRHEIGHFYHLDNKLNCNTVRTCLVCGRDISSQATTSKYCSENIYGKQGKRCRNNYNNLKYKIKRIEDKGVLFDITEYVNTPSISRN